MKIMAGQGNADPCADRVDASLLDIVACYGQFVCSDVYT